MNLNPIILIQRGLALFGIGNFYLYKHDSSLNEKKPTIEGPYYIRPNLKKITMAPSVIPEVKFRFKTPEGAVRPIRGEK
ncbi:MAG: hypothetical protein AAB441_05390 [Patescibacteria group bacterium]